MSEIRLAYQVIYPMNVRMSLYNALHEELTAREY